MKTTDLPDQSHSRATKFTVIYHTNWNKSEIQISKLGPRREGGESVGPISNFEFVS